MTETKNVDIVVLGLGPGGEHAAIKLGRAGLDVVAIEDRLVGGECPYFGCVPSKMMIAAATSLAVARTVPDLAGTVEVRPDWAPVAARIREEATDDWDDRVAVDRLEDSGVTFVRGRGRLDGPGRVRVGDTTYVAAHGVVLNTGTAPAVPPIEGLADTPFWTNQDIVKVTDLPASLVVIGGGPIGCELAQVFARFGVDVTVVEMTDRLVAGDEPEASRLLEQQFATEGIAVRTGVEIASVRHADGRFTLQVGEEQVSADKLLVAAGRTSNLSDIGLETVGLDPAERFVDTDERMRAAEKLWAVGDITGKGAFTHVSMYQAAVAIRDLLGEDGPWADYRAVTRVTFTGPEVASVGLTEAAARDQGLDAVTGTGDLGARGWLAKQEGLVKVVADRERRVLVGATVVGETAGEMIAMLTTAIHAEVPIDTLRAMHFAYPTFHRAIESVLDDLGV